METHPDDSIFVFSTSVQHDGAPAGVKRGHVQFEALLIQPLQSGPWGLRGRGECADVSCAEAGCRVVYAERTSIQLVRSAQGERALHSRVSQQRSRPLAVASATARPRPWRRCTTTSG